MGSVKNPFLGAFAKRLDSSRQRGRSQTVGRRGLKPGRLKLDDKHLELAVPTCNDLSPTATFQVNWRPEDKS